MTSPLFRLDTILSKLVADGGDWSVWYEGDGRVAAYIRRPDGNRFSVRRSSLADALWDVLDKAEVMS